MKGLEHEIEQLEDQLDQKTKELRQLKRRLSRYEELLELTGVKDREAQESSAQKLISAVMQLPYLASTTALGRAGELQRLAQRLDRTPRASEGEEVPRHLRPPNFARNAGNRKEAAELWKTAEALAAEALDDGLLSHEEWEEWTSEGVGLSLLDLVKQLEHLDLVPLYAEELQAHVAAQLDGAWVPEGYLQRVERACEQSVRGFKNSSRQIPITWTDKLWAVLGAGFQRLETPWERKGVSQEYWESLDLLEQLALQDNGVGKDFWHSCAFCLMEMLMEGQYEAMRKVIEEEVDDSVGEVFRLSSNNGRTVAELVMA